MINWSKLTTLLMCMALMSACTQNGSIRPTQHVAPDPDAAEINVQLGLNYLQRGDYAVALDKLEKALKQNPN
jgi:type IV pilus assembly protein PilF